jgi:hypothetical protein
VSTSRTILPGAGIPRAAPGRGWQSGPLTTQIVTPSSRVYTRILEQLGFFSALGVVIVFIAAGALGRIASVPAGIRAPEPVPEPSVPAVTVPVRTVREVRDIEDEDTQIIG